MGLALVERGAPQAGERVRALILATKHDAQPTGSDAQLLVDIDLAILGAAPERFDEYERQVQVEYSWVPEEAFRKARVGILEQFLERPAIYSTDAFASRLESSACQSHALSCPPGFW